MAKKKRDIKKKIKAWLVTWEWVNENAKKEPKVVAVLDPRWSGEKVREFVEHYYAASRYSISEKIRWIHKRANPYPANFVDINGVPYCGAVHCGAHPYLYARLVEDLHVTGDGNGKELAVWRDCPIPKPFQTASAKV